MTASIRGGIFTMAMLLKGAEVAKALTEELHAKTEELKKNGVEPCLAILRVGAREDDLAYERGALKRCEKVGVTVRQVVLPEDVTQEVLIKLYREKRDFESMEHVKRWLIRVTVNQSRKLFRSPWRRVEPLEDYAEMLGFEQPEDRGLFLAVMGLEAKYRLPVLLYYYEGYSTAETAELLGLPPNTVSTRLARARARLRETLSEVD